MAQNYLDVYRQICAAHTLTAAPVEADSGLAAYGIVPELLEPSFA